MYLKYFKIWLKFFILFLDFALVYGEGIRYYSDIPFTKLVK